MTQDRLLWIDCHGYRKFDNIMANNVKIYFQ